MSKPIQNLIIDDSIDIGLSADLINGTYKTFSLTDLSNNVYNKINDLSSNVYTTLNTKQSNLTTSTNLIGIGTNITALNYNNITLNKPTNFQSDWNSTIINKPSIYTQTEVNNLLNSLNASNITTGTLSVSRGGTGTTSFTSGQILIGNGTSQINSSGLLTWNSTTNTLSATNLSGTGYGITNIDYDNIYNKPDLSSYQQIITVSPPLAKSLANEISIDLTGYASTSSINTIYNTLATKQNLITVSSPLIKDISNNISIDLSAYALASSVTQNSLTFSSPLIKNVNNISIDLSGYTLLSSFNTLSNTVSTKQNLITVSTPLIKDISNNLSIDLSGYTLLSSFNTLSNTVSTKQNLITVSTPLIKDISNNISIDLSAYPLKTYVDSSLNAINTTLSSKQNNLTFSNPFLNTSNTITLKYNSSQFNIDSSGNLSLLSSLSYLPLSGGTITGALTLNNVLSLANAQWHKSNDNIQRFYYTANGTTYFHSGNVNGDGFIFRNTEQSSDIFVINDNGNVTCEGQININNNKKLIFNDQLNDMKIQLYTGFGIGINDFTLRYTSNTDHKFYNGTTNTMSIDGFGNMTCLGNFGATNFLNISGINTSPQSLSFRGQSYNIGIAGGIGQYSTWAVQNDMTIRTLTATNLILQSGSSNGTIYINSSNKVGIGTSSPSSILTINPIVIDRWTYDHSLAPLTITNQTSTSNTVLNDSLPVLNLCRQGTTNTCYGARATFEISRYEHSGTNARTRLDLVLTHDNYAAENNVLTLLSSGNVGIGIANPGYGLELNSTTGLRISSSGKLSINGTGNFEVDASGTTGGRFIINSSGNIGIGKNNPNCKLYINTGAGNTTSNSFALRISSGGGTDGGAYACLIGLAHESNGWSKGGIGWIRKAGYDQGDMVFLNRNTNDGNDCDMNYERMRLTRNGFLGIYNNNPLSYLHLGNLISVSDPGLIISKNNGAGGTRNAFMAYSSNFYLAFGDNGNSASANNFVIQLAIHYQAAADALIINSNGSVTMKYGYGTGSDERIKTNIYTIENALEKTLLLRGVHYTLIQEQTKSIGLIAQEVEYIIPEVVKTNEKDGLKSIEYQNLVALLIESIKGLNKKVENLENILKKNNLY